MKKSAKKAVAVLLAFAMVATTLVTGANASAAKKKKAKKPKLSVSKLTVYKGSTKTVTIKNVKAKKLKSVKWSTKNKKVATVKKSSRTKAKIKGIKAGKTTTITCKFKVGKKKYTKKVKVTVKKKKTPTPTPVNPTPVPVNPTPVPATPTPGGTTDNGQYGAVTVTESNQPEGAVAGALYCEDFNDGPGKFIVRGPEDSQIILETANYGFGGKCLLVKNRVNAAGEGKSWSGAQVSLKDCGAIGGKDYVITAWVMAPQMIKDPAAAKGDKKRGIVLSKIAVNADGTESDDYSSANLAESEWISLKGVGDVRPGQWVKLQATVTMPSEGDMRIYFETPGVNLTNSGKSVNYFIDSFSVKEVTGKIDSSKLPSIADAYRGILNLGTALGADQVRNSVTMADVLRQFKSADTATAALTGGSITMGNEMKPGSFLSDTLVDASTVEGLPASYKEDKVPSLNFANIDETLKLAKQYGLRVRGHVLVWHAQTPDWFFRENYDSSTKKYVSKEVMDARLEWYIKSVMEHMKNTEGGEMIYCWDVVNETIMENGSLREACPESDTNDKADQSKSKWVAIYGGDEFIVNAFKYARTYAGENVELYYNDYNEYFPAKRDAIVKLANKLKAIKVGEKPIIDGIGMQMHLTNGSENNSLDKIKAAIEAYAGTGLKVQITELDMCKNGQEKSDEFAASYRSLFELLVEEKDNLDMVVLWGINDEGSWRKEKYPTLWRAGFQPKMAFWEVVNAGLKAQGKAELTYTEDDYYKDTATIQ